MFTLVRCKLNKQKDQFNIQDIIQDSLELKTKTDVILRNKIRTNKQMQLNGTFILKLDQLSKFKP